MISQKSVWQISGTTYRRKIVLYSIFVQRSRFWGYFLSFFRNMNRKLFKNKKNWKKAIAFFSGGPHCSKWLIIQSRPFAHNNQNVGLNMGFYSGFFKKSSILAENAVNKNARFSRKKRVMTFLSQKQRGHDFFGTKIKELWKKVIKNFMTLKIMSKNFMTLKKMLKNFMTLTIPSGPG